MVPAKVTTATAISAGTVQASVRAEFAAAEQKYAETFNAALEQANVRDAAALDALRKRVGVSDLDLLKKVSEAQVAVAQCAAIAYVSPQRASAAEKDSARIKAMRDRSISDTTRATFSRLKFAYAECLRKAVEADDIELAKGIKAKMDAIGQ